MRIMEVTTKNNGGVRRTWAVDTMPNGAFSVECWPPSLGRRIVRVVRGRLVYVVGSDFGIPLSVRKAIHAACVGHLTAGGQ